MALVFGLGYVALTLAALRGGLSGAGRLAVVGFDTPCLALGGGVVLAAAALFGPAAALALVIAAAIHEFGHVAAHRAIGHDDARFRLVPLPGGPAVSDRVPARQAEDFFVALLGAGVSVAPMVLAHALAGLLAPARPGAAELLRLLAAAIACFNLVSLLPFRPFDGGRCARLLADTFFPPAAAMVAVAAGVALAVLAVHAQSYVLLLLALVALQGLLHTGRPVAAQAPMTPGEGALAAGAWAFTAAAHLAGSGVLPAGLLPT
ncbi:MAG: hypothetical protein N2Z62_13020 [Rhodobacteraceae bacterium]|nr:hypothetical protein [Paracoccaceae bacterium]